MTAWCGAVVFCMLVLCFFCQVAHSRDRQRQPGLSQTRNTQSTFYRTQPVRSGPTQIQLDQSRVAQSVQRRSGLTLSVSSQIGVTSSVKVDSGLAVSGHSHSGLIPSADDQSRIPPSAQSHNGITPLANRQSKPTRPPRAESGLHPYPLSRQRLWVFHRESSRSYVDPQEVLKSPDDLSPHAPPVIQSALSTSSGLDQWPRSRHVRQSGQGCGLMQRRVDLSHRNLTHLPSNYFRGGFLSAFCARLVLALDLSFNQLSQLPHDLLTPLASLQILDLSHNNLCDVRVGLFTFLWRPRVLDLSHNDLVLLLPGVLPRRVVHVDVSFNRLTQLVDGVFRQLPDLQSVDVSHNAITVVHPNAFKPGSSHLNVINCSHNHLAVFEPWPYLLNQHLTVDLSHNLISRFTNSINVTVQQEMMGDVYLTYNRLKHLRQEDFAKYFDGRLPTVMEIGFYFKLKLQHNPFVCDCHMYWVVSSLDHHLLTYLRDIKYYITCDSPPTLRGQNMGFLIDHPDLLMCDVTVGCPEGCQCRDTPHEGHVVVSCDPHLHTYNYLPLILPANGWLSLNLSGHELHVLGGDGGDISKLSLLDVSHNHISQVLASFLDKAKHLQVLNLRYNQLTSLPSDLKRLTLHNLRLEGNPLECSCDLEWLGDRVKATRVDPTVTPASNTSDDSEAKSVWIGYHQSLASLGKDLGLIVYSPDSGSQPSAPSQSAPDVYGGVSLTCVRSDGRVVGVADTSQWSVDCGPPVTVLVVVVCGVLLLGVLVGIAVCWRWRYNVRVMTKYVCQRVCCCKIPREYEDHSGFRNFTFGSSFTLSVPLRSCVLAAKC